MFNCTNCNLEKESTEFYKGHKQCKYCFRLKYYTNKRESLKLYWAEHFQKNKQKKQEYSKLYKRANRDKVNSYARKSYVKDPQKSLSYCHNRRAKLKGGTITKRDWQERLEEFNYSCAYCLEQFDTLEMDHMQALSIGGSHSIENLVPACRFCNSKKSNKTLVQFVQDGALYVY